MNHITEENKNQFNNIRLFGCDMKVYECIEMNSFLNQSMISKLRTLSKTFEVKIVRKKHIFWKTDKKKFDFKSVRFKIESVMLYYPKAVSEEGPGCMDPPSPKCFQHFTNV
jgi:hypothetical protein